MPPRGQSPGPASRLPALRRFAVAITVLNVLGHFVLGFEQSWAQPLVALATAYGVELILESVGAWAERRTVSVPRRLVSPSSISCCRPTSRRWRSRCCFMPTIGSG